MTQAQAIERGYTHFIEVWRKETWIDGINNAPRLSIINELDIDLKATQIVGNLYTVAIFLIKPKQ